MLSKSSLKSIVSDKNIKIEFKEIRYEVVHKKAKKLILDGIEGSFKSGEVVAIVGPSGAGKSSLLTILAGKVPKNSKASGELLVNGKTLSSGKFKKIASFVFQDDILYALQTVEETLLFSSNLRAPADLSKEERREQCDVVINQLGLTKCKNTRIGNQNIRGISGGEKKRVCIGSELIRDVDVIFLDEPTTGLDSFMAYIIIEKLRKFAKEFNKIVVFTIHQPSSDIFELFDKLMVLSNGRQVYFGDAKESIGYFGEAGYECPEGFNITDHILDICTPDYRTEETEKESNKRIENLTEKWQKLQSNILTSAEGSKKDEKEIETELPIKTKRKSNFFNQFPMVFRRESKEFIRNWSVVLANIIQNVFFGLLIGLVFFRLDYNDKNIQERASVIYYALSNQAISVIFEMLNVFFIDKSIIKREVESGFYSPFAVYFSKLILNSLLQPIYGLLFALIVYFMTNLYLEFERFCIFYVVMFLCRLCSVSIGITIGAIVPKLEYAFMIGPVVVYISILCTGFFARASNLSTVFDKIQYIVYIRYAFRIMFDNEFKGALFDVTGKPGETITGEKIIESFGVQDVNYTGHFFAIIGLTCFYVAVGAFVTWYRTERYVVLKSKKKEL